MVEAARNMDQASGELGLLLGQLALGQAVAVGGDSFVPLLLAPGGGGPDADLLEEGLASGTTSLGELGEAGQVSRVRVHHAGQRLLLLVGGEQILGAKQNRVFNASFLVGPGSEVEVPVSCVERGRWRYESRDFRLADTTLTGTARSRSLRRVSRSLTMGRGYDAEQGAVWRDVDEYLERSRVVSKTAALEDGIAARRATTEQALALLVPQPGQVGLAQVRGKKLVLLDLFGSAELYARGYRKIAAGMLADIAPAGAEPPGDAARVVAGALAGLARAALQRRPAPGCGETLHGEEGGLAVSAVTYEGRLYHAAVAAA